MFGMDMEDKLEKLNYLRKVWGGRGGELLYVERLLRARCFYTLCLI